MSAFIISARNTGRRHAAAAVFQGWGEFWAEFRNDEGGQDLIEYSLMLAFVSLSGAALYIGMGTTMNAIWGIVNTRLSAANQSASS